MGGTILRPIQLSLVDRPGQSASIEPEVMETSEKCILLAVTGGIAAYRACDLTRALVKDGLPVRVIMTRNAEKFVGRVSFEALSGHPVHTDEFAPGMAHIDLKNMAQVFVVAPATANIIGKFAGGIADDLVTSTYLALACPVFLAPAMNPNMYAHPAVQRNLNILREDGVQLFYPEEGEVVCGDVGRGKMASVDLMARTIREVYWREVRPETIV